MGKHWVVDLGLGRHFSDANAFHRYCRACHIERRVREQGGGFGVLAELRAAFEASCARPDRWCG